MPAANPLKRFVSWLTVDEEDEESEQPETQEPTSTVSAAATPPPSRRQRERGPLVLQERSEGGVEIRHPRSLDDRMAIGMDLKQRRMVTLDLTRLPESEAAYFLEFVYGVVFALDATVEKVTEGIFFLAPRGVAIRNDGDAPTATSARTAAGSRIVDRLASASAQEESFWQAPR
jgi:cell division inhibitor SepF